MASLKFRFDNGEITRNLRNLPDKVNSAVAVLVDVNAIRGQGYLKAGAPWTDRTGAARTGLHTAASNFGDKHTITFAHAVHYGIWLEVKFSGRDAIIMPTVRKVGFELMRDLNGLIGKIR